MLSTLACAIIVDLSKDSDEEDSESEKSESEETLFKATNTNTITDQMSPPCSDEKLQLPLIPEELST